MKAFVTGGSGFIGQHVVRKLRQRGYEVSALARSERSAAVLAQLGATVVPGNITDTASMRQGMQGSDIVFHLAGWYKLGSPDWMQAEATNVRGSRKVLRLAHELGVPKIVYTSTVNVFGDTRGQLVDETFYQEGPFVSEYDRTKWLAHYKVVLPLIEKGAPIIIVMPGPTYGPGDKSFVADMMRRFYRGIPAVPGPHTTVTYTHVEDVAEGHLLAAEKGRIGESYILVGPAIPLGDMVDFWARLTGRPAPSIHLPAQLVRPFAPLMGALNTFLPLPSIFSQEGIASLGVTYMARSDKARAELGWRTRPLQTGMLETFTWIAETEAQRQPAVPRTREQQLAGLALGTAIFLFLTWLLFGRRRQ
jgi:dihydroflavonol-4-reductase